MSVASLAKAWAISCGRRKGRNTVMVFPVFGCRVRTSAQYRLEEATWSSWTPVSTGPLRNYSSDWAWLGLTRSLLRQ
eukprot:10519295-Heterocapsa_arctica.AAC.1